MFVSAAFGGAASSVVLWDPPSAAWGALAVNAVVAILVAILIGATGYLFGKGLENVCELADAARGQSRAAPPAGMANMMMALCSLAPVMSYRAAG
jgi:hypothetical protein